MRLDRVVVGQQRHEAGVGDPTQKPIVPAIERSAGLVQHLGIRVLVHFQQGLRKTRSQADKITFLDFHMVALQHGHQIVVADDLAGPAEMSLQVNHDTTALHAVPCHVLHAQSASARCLMHRGCVSSRVVPHGADNILAGAKTVVEDVLRRAVAIGVKGLSDMRQAVPLRGGLQGQHHLIVAHNIGRGRVIAAQRIGHIRFAVAHRWPQLRRGSPRIQYGPAGIIQGQRQAECDSRFTSAMPCRTFFEVTRFSRPSSSSGPKSPQVDPSGRCDQRRDPIIPSSLMPWHHRRTGCTDNVQCGRAICARRGLSCRRASCVPD